MRRILHHHNIFPINRGRILHINNILPINNRNIKSPHFTPVSFPLRPRAGHFYVKPFSFRIPPCHAATFRVHCGTAATKTEAIQPRFSVLW